MTLLFDPFESIVLFFSGATRTGFFYADLSAEKKTPSVLVVNYVTQDGKSNWLEGFLLMSEFFLVPVWPILQPFSVLYFILALTFWYYPGMAVQFSFHKCHSTDQAQQLSMRRGFSKRASESETHSSDYNIYTRTDLWSALDEV